MQGRRRVGMQEATPRGEGDSFSDESSPASSLLRKISDWFVPIQSGEDAEALTRRARLLLAVLAVSAANLIFTASMHVRLDNLEFATGMLAVLPIPLAVAFCLRLGVSIGLLTQFTVFMIWTVSVAVALSTAGRVAGGLFFLVLVPAIAVLIVGRRAGLWWAGMTCATLLGVSVYGDSAGITPILELSDAGARDANLRSAGLVMLAVGALAYFYSALHQQAQDALLESVARYQQGERRFRAITEYAYDLIAELDGEGRYVFASPGFEEVLGWRPEQLVGRFMRDGVHPEDVGRAEAYWNQLCEKGVVRQDPLRLCRATGESRWFELSLRAFESTDGESRVVMVAREVTERIEREKMMRQQEKLLAGGTMAAGAAHQLNNPLGAILAAAQYAKQFKWNPSFGDLAGDSLDAIEEEANRCTRILRSMLAFARAESSERWTEEIKAVLRRAVRAIEIEEPESEAEIVLSLTKERAVVLMSPIEIEQVVINLIRNAIQAEASVIVVGLTVADDSVARITVSDDGKGMEDPVPGSAFEAFYTTHPDSGSGLGLTIAREIVEDHGGEISIVKSDSEGSVVRVELPLAQSQVLVLPQRS